MTFWYFTYVSLINKKAMFIPVKLTQLILIIKVRFIVPTCFLTPLCKYKMDLQTPEQDKPNLNYLYIFKVIMYFFLF